MAIIPYYQGTLDGSMHTGNQQSVPQWSERHALWVLLCAVLSLIFSSYLPLLVGGTLSFLWLVYTHRSFLNQVKPFGGYANLITFCRLLLVVASFALLQWISVETMALLLGGSLILDLLDGYVARKLGQQSIFGQFFDMEVDAYFVLLMCLFYFWLDESAYWVLIPGFIRYLYSFLLTIYPREGFQESRKSYAAIIAGIFFVILVVALLLPAAYQLNILFLGTLLILASFGYSTYHYLTFSHED